MQEAGNNISFQDKKLSIQLLLNGLYFYSNEDNKYTFRQIKNQMEVVSEIKKEISNDKFETVSLCHNSIHYIIVPSVLFDEQMCEAYLQSKNIIPQDNQTIKHVTIGQYTYISIIDNDICQILAGEAEKFDVLPTIASVISYSENLNCDNITLIVKDDLIHIAYHENKLMMFCETLPIVSDTDIDFFISKVLSDNSPRKSLKVVSLFETEKKELNSDIISKYNIERLTKDNFFAL